VAQAEGQEILRRAPLVNIVIGPQSYHRLPDHIFSAEQHKQRIVDTEFPTELKFEHLPERSTKKLTAFLTVQEGCDKFCTFCVVPYTRGGEYSRPVKQIIAEARDLVAKGAREITLLGQNVNAYHGQGKKNGNKDGSSVNLARLIKKLAKIEGLERLRYTTSHPNDMSEDLILAHRDIEKLMPYLHLPFQSGSNKILEAMNRKHDIPTYLETIERFREVRPDIAISTDIIVGFPGETDKDFEATLDLVRRVKYAQAFSFKYSNRPGTTASTMENQIEEHVASERLQILQELLKKQQLAFNKTLIGRKLPILLEKPGRLEEQLVGRSPYLQPVHVIAPDRLIGEIITVKITDATRNSLTGKLETAKNNAPV
jgi:tRNA-2-methylthio-N6-dimethylallyladenosine synthase